MNRPSEKPAQVDKPQALWELIVGCQSRIAGALSWLRLTNEAIQDIMQSTWLRLIKEQTESGQTAWNFEERAIEIAKETARIFLQENKARKVHLWLEATTQTAPRIAHEIYASVEQMRGLNIILENLSPRERECLDMRLTQADDEDIARQLRIKPEDVPNMIERIRRKIKRQWETRQEFERMFLEHIAQYEQAQ